MKTSALSWRAAVLAAVCFGLLQTAQADWFVATNGVGAGTNGWADATNNLQGAINACTNSGTVWVSNGVYNTGWTTNVPAGCTNMTRIAINKAITVRSFEGQPTNTIIQGAWDPQTNGPTSVRCVYLAAGATLVGFTITNGATIRGANGDYAHSSGGGVYCPANANPAPVMSNCLFAGNAAAFHGGAAYYGVLRNCTLAGNLAVYGGGAKYSSLYGCTLIGNSATVSLGTYTYPAGGAAGNAYLYDCLVMSNTSPSYTSGGLDTCTAEKCRLIGNSAGSYGGGASSCTLSNCVLLANRSGQAGGGLYQGTLYNCLVANNVANYGGGVASVAASFQAYNCTIVSNTATATVNLFGGGVYGGGSGGQLVNCIVLYNTGNGGYSNWQYGVFAYSCSAPTPSNGLGNITGDPNFVNRPGGDYHLASDSPCNNTGLNQGWMYASKDLDGTNCRIANAVVDMGAYEYVAPGSLSCSFRASPAIALAPATNIFASIVSDSNPASLYYQWDFDNNGTIDAQGTGLMAPTNVYTQAGYYSPVLTVSNGVQTAVFTNLFLIKAGPVAYCIATNGPGIYPYTNWATASSNFAAVLPLLTWNDTATVSNGSYYQSALPFNGNFTPGLPLNVSTAATISSVNGAEATIVARHASLTNGLFNLSHSNAVLQGFTITNGLLPSGQGAGVYLTGGATLKNCIVTGCLATNGGGVYVMRGGTVRNCLIAGNYATNGGGGICVWSTGTVENCTIAGNVASNTAGGLFIGQTGRVSVVNSIIYGNTGVLSNDNWLAIGASGYTFSNCFTTPLTGLPGANNYADDPQFKAPASRNYRLKLLSPCFNRGMSLAWMNTAVDLDGQPRVLFGAPDVGAYESTMRPTGTLLLLK